MSPVIQNEIIEIIGQDTTLKNLLEEIKAAKLYSIIADEVTSHNKEQLALCALFMDNKTKTMSGRTLLPLFICLE